MALYDRKDRLYRQAKEEGYRGRAAYKLLELDEKLHLLKPGMRVLDLGSFPGGWLQVAASKIGPKGIAVGVDLKDIPPFAKKELGGGKQPQIFKGDITDPGMQEAIISYSKGPFDLLLSDMSPALSGIHDRDVARMAELLETSLFLTPRLLKKRGSFVAKTFPSPEVDAICRKYKAAFTKLDRTRLKSTRNTSNELYLVGHGFSRSQLSHTRRLRDARAFRSS